ncbi:MAG: hypothetical protein D3907_05525 [Candidatus Electrothrix sp. AUS3]|nr:hypothetical protein [Candidatus Electrothrix gigas]
MLSVIPKISAGGDQAWKTFIYTLGGIYIGVEVNYQNFQEHSCSPVKKRFVSSAGCEKHSITKRDIAVRFALFDQKVSPQPINKIFSQRLSDLYTTSTGYVQFFYLTAAKKNLPGFLKLIAHFLNLIILFVQIRLRYLIFLICQYGFFFFSIVLLSVKV